MVSQLVSPLLLLLCASIIGCSSISALAVKPSGNKISNGSSSSPLPNRRNVVAGVLSSIAVVGGATAPTLTGAAVNTGKGAEVFLGTYSDPNHPGGTRTIRLLENMKVGDYYMAEVTGGGGRGEPKNYVLPAVAIGSRFIIIDFSPKGGPRDFTGVIDSKTQGLKFLKDGNLWPRIGE